MSFIFLRNRVTGGAAFSPASLFASGEEGAWYEPSTTNCFTDTAGTTAASVGDAVARINDLSGNGNHATQTNPDARPILARVPETGRRNLLERTEEFDNAVWKKNGVAFVTANADNDPNGELTADRLTFSSSFINTWLGQSGITFQSGVTYTFSVWLKRVSGAGSIRINTNPYGFGGSWVTVAITSEWQRFSVTQTATATTSPIAAAGILAVEVGQVVDVSGAQLEVGSSATAYQKVVDQYDITEAGVTSVSYVFDDEADDAISWTAPADTDYTIARVDTGGTVTILTGQSLSGATDILLEQDIAGYVAVDRALTSQETTDLTAYLEALA